MQSIAQLFMQSVITFLKALLDPEFMPMAVRVAAVVGTILFAINHGSAVIQRQMTRDRWISGLLTYGVPYSVNIHGQLVSRQRSRSASKNKHE